MPAAPRPARRAAALAVLVLTGALLSACRGVDTAEVAGRPSFAPGTPIPVVAVENVWGDVVRQIGGQHVSVTSILEDPSADPHSYETDPRAAAALGSAVFVVENGLGYDAFADKLLDASGSPREVVTLSDVVGVDGDDANPHLWYSPQYVQAAARGIAARLTEADPSAEADVQAGLASFLQGYQPYVDTIAAIEAKHGGTPVAYTERVPGYLLEAAGLTLGVPASFAQSVEDGSDPSPADTDAVDRALREKDVAVLLYNAQVTSPVTDSVQELARAGGVPVVGVTETLPAGEDFQTWQADQAKALLAALDAGS